MSSYKEQMISPSGVKANMCCASCAYYDYALDANFRSTWRCTKNSQPTITGSKCYLYVMAEFFQKKGYKPITE